MIPEFLLMGHINLCPFNTRTSVLLQWQICCRGNDQGRKLAQDSSKHFSWGLLLNLADWNSQSKLHLEKKYSRYHDVRVLKDSPTNSQSRVWRKQTVVNVKSNLKELFCFKNKTTCSPISCNPLSVLSNEPANLWFCWSARISLLMERARSLPLYTEEAF